MQAAVVEDLLNQIPVLLEVMAEEAQESIQVIHQQPLQL